jgi:SagB-type dehydrogenase family enzyme
VPARDPLAIVREYHEQTKHHFNRFARSLGYLDWATQPDPFRSFEGCRRIDLVEPLRTAEVAPADGGGSWRTVAYDGLFGMSPQRPPLAPGLPAVSVFLRYSLGLSAWKQAGASRWALRVNPSSGNLHPTEGYVVCGPGVAASQPGVYHYAPDTHALEERCVFDASAWAAHTAALPEGSFLAALTSIHWREAWKYGERAFRYCQHDIGHAVAAMHVAAAMMGWTCAIVPGWPSEALAALLGTDRGADFEGAEREEPACLMVVTPGTSPGLRRAAEPSAGVSVALLNAVQRGTWSGHANRLSGDHVQWDWIDAVAEASRDEGAAGALAGRPAGAANAGRDASARPAPRGGRSIPASRLFLQRRSAMAMDGTASLGLDRFAALLRRLLPDAGPPFDAFPWSPRIHLALFVHRVDGLQPGLYAVPRTGAGEALMRKTLNQGFAWERPLNVPDDLPLFLLERADCRRIARQLSCGQDIAADGCFSLGMLAEFDAALSEGGPAAYRRLFWEAGAVGQALYLEAEAAGLRGTGIGCFFDDGVHQLLGLGGGSETRAQGDANPRHAGFGAGPLQSLYHFTVGGPVEDSRLTTHPGYPWEQSAG